MKSNKKVDVSKMLPEGFIERMQNCHEILQEVMCISLEEFLHILQESSLPDLELYMYEGVAENYMHYLNKYSELGIAQKKEIYAEAQQFHPF